MFNEIELPTNEIIKLYTVDKMTLSYIANKFNVSIHAISIRLKKHNIKTKYHHQPHRIKLNNTNIIEIIRLYTIEHISSVDIGKLFGLSSPTVIRYLRENNIKITGNHDRTYAKDRINIGSIPKLISNISYEQNGYLIGYVTCPICNNTRKLTLSTVRINEILNRNGRCNPCAMKDRKIKLDFELIKRLYCDELWTTTQIGEHLGVSNNTILHNLKQQNITTNRMGKINRIRKEFKLKESNRGTLENPIIGDKCKGTEIGIRNDSYYIYVECPKCHKTRWQEKTKATKYGTLCLFCATNPTVNNRGTIDHPVIGDIRHGKDINKGNTHYIYISCPECYKTRWTPLHHSKKHPRCDECAKKIMGLTHRGEKSANWLGGLSSEGYPTEWNDKLKEWIRGRDNHTCQLCGTPQNGIALAVHHIDYRKKNIHPNNLISLCTQQKNSKGCHIKTNQNREYWTEYFTNLLKEKGLYITRNKQFILPI